MNRKLSFALGLAAALGAAALSGCFGDDDHAGTVPEPTGTGNLTNVDFSAFVYKVYEEPANSTPINFDTTVFVYDADNDPNAFSGLFM